MTASIPTVPTVIRLLADPLRWRLTRELAWGDRRVRELTSAVGEPQNLVSYHLRQLRSAGLVTARRSSFDGRDTYYRLDLDSCGQALADSVGLLHPSLARRPAIPEPQTAAGAGRRKVLFVCTGNTGRSPMAAALLVLRAGPAVEAVSAGVHPKPLNLAAVAVMRDRYCLDISAHQPTSVEAVAGERFNFAITLCDKAREGCPDFSGRPGRLHWSMSDPAAAEGELAGYPAFERTAAELDIRIRYFLPALQEPLPAAS